LLCFALLCFSLLSGSQSEEPFISLSLSRTMVFNSCHVAFPTQSLRLHMQCHAMVALSSSSPGDLHYNKTGDGYMHDKLEVGSSKKRNTAKRKKKTVEKKKEKRKGKKEKRKNPKEKTKKKKEKTKKKKKEREKTKRMPPVCT